MKPHAAPAGMHATEFVIFVVTIKHNDISLGIGCLSIRIIIRIYR